MRPLSTEEIAYVRRTALSRLELGLAGTTLFGALFAAVVLAEGASRGDWRFALTLGVLFAAFVYGVYGRPLRRIKADLKKGFVLTAQGQVELRRPLWGTFFYGLWVAGHGLQAPRDVYKRMAEGQQVTVEFLPRSRFIVRIEPRNLA